MSDDTKKLFSLNLNSLLMFVLLGVMAWLGSEVRSTALALAELRGTAGVTAKNNAEALARLEGALSSSVSRREFDVRVLAVESKLAEVSVRLREIDLLLVRLQAQSAKP